MAADSGLLLGARSAGSLDLRAHIEALHPLERSPSGPTNRIVVAPEQWARDRVVPSFALRRVVRRSVQTTNAVESSHNRNRKVVKTRGSAS